MHATNVSAFQRTVVRVAVRGALSAAAILGPAIGITALPTPAAASTTSPISTFAYSPNKHPDFDPDALFISTTTDTLPEDAATHFQAMAGDTVRRVYEVHNRGLLPLDNVTVFDPGANGAAIHCGSSGRSTIPTLLPLTWVTCTSAFTATPGEHLNTVTASGTIFLLGVTLTDEARTGYTAVAPALSASLSINGAGANLPSGTPVPATVTVHNTGSVVFTQVTAAPQPPLSITGCSDGQDHDPTIHNLTPGESANCTAVLVPAPGPHVSSVTITANWRWDHPITQQGPQKPEELSVQTVASAAYTGSPVTSPTPTPTPAPPSPGPSTSASPPATPGAPTPSSAVVVPQSQQPTPPPSQTPSTSASPGPTPPNTPAPTPNPSQAGALLQQGVSQFQASRQLPLPLKVLVIIIIPAVAAAAGARRISSSRR